MLRSKLRKLLEMSSLTNCPRRRLEEEKSTSSLRISETNFRFKSKRNVPDKLSVKK
jgi:hypothetical protein